MKNSKKQVFNPYLPTYEYIPDGEPHVFGDRIYIFGSHDRFDGEKFCLNDYVCYSAPVTDLTEWRYEGVIYRKTQDPRLTEGEHELWAPDVVRGKDGRYYLYYCPDDSIWTIGVAVCDTPAGEYEFLGIVQDKEGRYIGERVDDTIQFDPGVFIDDDGTIYLYSGNGPRVMEDVGKEPKASVVMTLEDDMITIKTEPKKLIPVIGDEVGGFAGHELFEASSIRKIKGQYYLVYSSINMHELCYAVSDRPDRGFRYGGTIISHCDIFPGTDRNKPMICFGNNHGGIERINGKWYVFYHRQTNSTVFSRQACAEEIRILEDGSIPQVEVTSCGLNQGSLIGMGTYSAGIVCNLYGEKTPTFSHPLAMRKEHPYLTQEGVDYVPEDNNPSDSGAPPKQFITNGKNGLVAGFKYFQIEKISTISVTLRGTAMGKIAIRTEPDGGKIGEIPVEPCDSWTEFLGNVQIASGIYPLYFCYTGAGELEFLEFAMVE